MVRSIPSIVGWLILLTAIVFFLVNLMSPSWLKPDLSFLDREQPSATHQVKIATGLSGGMYDEFGLVMKAYSRHNVKLTNSSGSIANIEMLKSGKVDFALVQNDIAQNVHLGSRGQERFENISYVVPVFTEYVQLILPRWSRVSVMTDLRGKQICVGEKGSGTYQNSIDVLQEAGLRETIDFFPVLQSAENCAKAIKNGERIAAMFLTSHRKLADEDSAFRQMFFSDSVARLLANKFRYFRKTSILDGNGEPQVQLAVDTFLVSRTNQTSPIVADYTQELVKNWPVLSRTLPGLLPFDADVPTDQIEYHAAAASVLALSGFKKSESWTIWIYVCWGTLLLVCTISWKLKASYNRMGRNPIRHAIASFLIVLFGGFLARVVFFITAAIVIIALAVGVLHFLEDRHAMQAGTVSPFARMDLLDSIVWLSAYIGSGFTSNVYPASMAGKAVTAFLAIVGIVTPFSAVMLLLNNLQDIARRAQKGLNKVNMQGHVVLCGWNEKAPGIIFTLTGKEVDQRKRVTIVANFDDQFPLEKYGFNSRYVAYCRGESSDIRILEQANVEQASAALILADFVGDGDELNKKSILSTMLVKRISDQRAGEEPRSRKLRNLKAPIHICAEMEHARNLDYFLSSGAESVISPTMIVSRMTVTTLLNIHLLDYIFDMVTYHNLDEIYSVAANLVQKDIAAEKVTLRDLYNAKIGKGVNILGAINPAKRLRNFDQNHSAGDYINAFSLDKPLTGDEQVIFSSKNFDRIYSRHSFARFGKFVIANIANLYFDKLFESLKITKLRLEQYFKHGVHRVASFRHQPVFQKIEGGGVDLQKTIQADLLARQKILICICDDRPADSQKTSKKLTNNEKKYGAKTHLERLISETKLAFGEEATVAQVYESEIDGEKAIESYVKNFDQIIILSTPEKRTSLNSIEELNAIDTDLLLLAQRFGAAKRKIEYPPLLAKIICETVNNDNKELFYQDAYVDRILPTTLLVERFISKEAFDRNHVTDFLLAGMDPRDGVQFHCHEVANGDGFCGLSYSDLLITPIDNIRLLAWLPLAEKGKKPLKNETGDFSYHFRTVIDYRFPDRDIVTGDILILLIHREKIMSGKRHAGKSKKTAA